MSSDSFLDSLNPAQLAAVQHPGGPAMVLAGAGSGKTRVLTSRVAWLIQEFKLSPEQVLLVTFTNKAAAEMNERVEKLVGIPLPFSGTFHRIGARILRRNGDRIGLGHTFVIFDSDDQEALVKSILNELSYNPKEFKARAILGMISQAKNELLTPEQYSDMAKGKYQEVAARVYKNYQFQLQKNNAVDFDDILLKTILLFRVEPSILNHYQLQFEHVLIDEYQDTNKAQYLLTQLLAAPQQNVYVVGDAAQAIYSWRGADYRNLLQLEHDFPAITKYHLDQNYRSTQTILDAASSVIRQNTTHPILELWTDQTQPAEQIQLYAAADNQDEAKHVAESIYKNFSRKAYHDVAILYRTNAQSRSFEEALLREGIPYRIVGGVRFYARKEVKDLLSYLRLVLNPQESVSLERMAKVGKRRYEAFARWREGLKDLAVELNPLEMLDQILQATQYKELFDPEDPEDLPRLENIEELRAVAHEFESLEQFLENVALIDNTASSQKDLADVMTEQASQGVTLMSIHSAKGLEFDTVFVAGLEEGLFPHSRSLMDKEQLEEERRLCYVALTRAKRQLFLSYARQRFTYGSLSPSLPSRFLKEIPEELLEISESRRVGGYEGQGYGKSSGQFEKYSPYNFSPNGYQGYKRGAQKESPKPTTPVRRVILDDSELDDILSGNIDVSAWLEK